MEHPLITYWRSTFRPYQKPGDQGLSFFLPLFPDPLMSPRFANGTWRAGVNFEPSVSHLNFIGRADESELRRQSFQHKQRFQLALRKVGKTQVKGFEVEKVPLYKAVLREDFWSLLERSFPNDIRFMRQLLPFLPVTNAVYTTAFLRDGGQTVGLMNVGVSARVALAMNAAVLPEVRGRGVCRALVDVAAQVARDHNAKQAVFWTQHEFLLRFADSADEYNIFVRA